ncbi:MAG: adenosylmethionine decarboxylase [Chloroflexi bacterium]|nr:adenosylmethionine decarboxylase [Chloroflexota bacterium]
MTMTVDGDGATLEAPVGVHCILELYQCPPALLNDSEFVEAAVEEASRQANSTLLSLRAHRFEPQGITAIALLAESHLSVHTWPERGYAAVDIFTCGQRTTPEAACHFLAGRFAAGRFSFSVLRRGGRFTTEEPHFIQHEVV